MPIDCSACSTANPDGNRFCGTCGTSLASLLSASLAVRPLEEIKQVTVLFADVVGSTELVAGLDPEEAMDRLRPAAGHHAREHPAVRRDRRADPGRWRDGAVRRPACAGGPCVAGLRGCPGHAGSVPGRGGRGQDQDRAAFGRGRGKRAVARGSGRKRRARRDGARREPPASHGVPIGDLLDGGLLPPGPAPIARSGRWDGSWSAASLAAWRFTSFSACGLR